MAQTEMTVKKIKESFPETDIEIVPKATYGDIASDTPLSQLGGRGAFVSEIERMLIQGDIDIAVHSAKDLPVQLAEGTVVGAVLERGNPRDVLVMRKGTAPEDFHDRSFIIGTGSQRRRAGFGQIYNNAEFRELRGNVGTRLAKLEAGEYDGIILAAAGLERLGLMNDSRFVFTELPAEKLLSAPCQGIIAVQCRKGGKCERLLNEVNHQETFFCFETERHFLKLINAGCNIPAGAFSQISGENISLTITADSVKHFSGTSYIGERFSLAERLVEQL